MKIDYPGVQIDKGKDTIILTEDQLTSPKHVGAIVERSGGTLANKAFFLSEDYDWIIVKDSQALLCLVPLKKTD